MIVRIYWTLWAIFLIAAIALFLTGNLTITSTVALGFVSFGLVFMGMMSVLPATIAHPAASVQSVEKAKGKTAVKEPVRQTEFQQAGFPATKSA